jgi:hypothetical protein
MSLPTGFEEIPAIDEETLNLYRGKQVEELKFDERTLKFYYNIIYGFYIEISLFRVRDTVIPARYVKFMFSPVNARVEWIAFDINNKYNIYPTRRIRADGRIEIPRSITEKFKLRRKIIRGEREFPLYIKYRIEPESKEMVLYLPYEEREVPEVKKPVTRLIRKEEVAKKEEVGIRRVLDYKTAKWYPINFIYRDYVEKAKILRYLYYDEMYKLFNSSFCWLYDFKEEKPKYEIEKLRLGLTNRNKDYIMTKAEYEKVLSFIIIKDKETGKPIGIKDARIFYKDALINAFRRKRCGWDTFQAKTYPECSYDIYLDVDNVVIDKYRTIDDYLKYLIPKLKQLGIKGKMYVIVSSYTIIPPKYNYHIVIEARLPFDKWLSIIDLLEEDELRKPFARLQGFNILRISRYSFSDLKLLYTLEI